MLSAPILSAYARARHTVRYSSHLQTAALSNRRTGNPAGLIPRPHYRFSFSHSHLSSPHEALTHFPNSCSVFKMQSARSIATSDGRPPSRRVVSVTRPSTGSRKLASSALARPGTASRLASKIVSTVFPGGNVGKKCIFPAKRRQRR